MNISLGEKVSEFILKLLSNNMFTLEEKCVHQGHIFYICTENRLYSCLHLILSRKQKNLNAIVVFRCVKVHPIVNRNSFAS